MVATNMVKRLLASLMSTWLRKDVPVADPHVELGFSQCVIVCNGLEFDAVALNEALMPSGSLLFQSAKIQTLCLKFLPWKNPVFSVEICNLSFVFCFRSPDEESCNKVGPSRRDAEDRKLVLQELDSQGRTLRAIVENRRNKKSLRFMRSLLANLVLQHTRIYLHDISFGLRLPSVLSNNLVDSHSVNGSHLPHCWIQSITLEDGFNRFNLFGGFLIAMLFSVVYSLRGCDGCKRCRIEGFEFTNYFHSNLHSVSVDKKSIISLKETVISTKIEHLELCNLVVDVQEAKMNISPWVLKNMIMILTYFDSGSTVACFSNAQSNALTKQHRCGRDLWEKVRQHVKNFTQKRQVKKCLRLVMLLLDYFHTYESWLKEVGWGPDACLESSSNQLKQKHISSHSEELWQKLCEMENLLPLNAIVSARIVARQRIWIQQKNDIPKENNKTSERHKYILHVLLGCSPLFSRGIRNLLEYVHSSMLIMCNILWKFVYFIGLLFNKKYVQYSNERNPPVPDTDDFLQVKQGEEFAKQMQLCYIVKMYKLSINLETDSVNDIPMSQEIHSTSLSEIAGSSLHFILDNIWLKYVPKENSLNFSLLCGELKGDVLSPASVEHFSKEFSMFENPKSVDTYIENSISRRKSRKRFLSSKPPPIQDFSADGSGNCRFDTMFRNHQRNLWSEWGSVFSSNNAQLSLDQSKLKWEPFIFLEFQAYTIDPFLRHPNSGLLDCGLCVGELIFDLDFDGLLLANILSLRFLDSVSAQVNGRSAPSSHSLVYSASSSNCVDRKWDEAYDIYVEKMKRVMLKAIPRKTVNFTTFIAGPKFKLSMLPTKSTLLNEDPFAEKSVNVLLVLDFGTVGFAIFPVDPVDKSECTAKPVFNQSSWLMKLPVLDTSTACTSISYMRHEQIGHNAFLKFENVSLQMRRIPGNQLLFMVDPLNITVQSSFCREEFGSLLLMDHKLIASVCCSSSNLTINCFLDELYILFEEIEEKMRSLFHMVSNFRHGGRGLVASHKHYTHTDFLSIENQDVPQISTNSLSVMPDTRESSTTSSFYITVTFKVESLNLIFEIYKEKGFRKFSKESNSSLMGWDNYQSRKTTGIGFNHEKRFCSSIIVFCICLQSCILDHLWDGQNHAKVNLSISSFHSLIGDSIVGNSRFREEPVSVSTIKNCFSAELKFHACVFSFSFGPLGFNQLFYNEISRMESSHSLTQEVGNTSSRQEILPSDKNYSCSSKNISLDSTSSLAWLVVDLDLSEGFITSGPIEAIISEGGKKSSGSGRMHVLFMVGRDFQTISCNVQGGICYIDTKALVTYMTTVELLICSISSLSTFSNSMDIAMKEHDTQILSHKRKSLLMPGMSSTENIATISHQNSMNQRKAFTGSFCFAIKQSALVLAYVNDSDEAHGILLEMDSQVSSEIGYENEKIAFNLYRLMIMFLHNGKRLRESKEKSNQVPHFTTSLSLSLPSGSELKGSCQQSIPDTCFSGRSALDIPVNNESTSSSSNFGNNDPLILNCMIASARMERSFEHEHQVWKWRDAWVGECFISGLHLKLTPSEISILSLLLSPLTQLSSQSEPNDSHMRDGAEYKGYQEGEFAIPHGAIVAIKDVEEQLYLTTEYVNSNYQLKGVLHYTLDGEKALFKVKYEDKGQSGSKQPCFSLLSLHAKDEKGEPYRLHYQSASSVIGISSTNNKANELWYIVPFKYTPETDKEEFDVFREECKKWVHLINKKSNSSFGFRNGTPMLLNQPGHPVKLKLLSTKLSTATKAFTTRDMPSFLGLEEDTVMKTSSVVPKVTLRIENLGITILFESPGRSHCLPLLQITLENNEIFVQFSSVKRRLISTVKFMIESYDFRKNMWTELLRKACISIVYSANAGCSNNDRSESKKMHKSLYFIIRKIDISFSEMSLDTCLFIVGELDVAGPYTIKNSPVRANACKIVNRTGLELLCYFDDKVGTRIDPWKSDSFLIRHMTSRSTLQLESCTRVGLQLRRSGPFGKELSEMIFISLENIGTTCTRTRILSENGQKKSPGPIVVIDVTNHKEGGLMVVVSPMIRIENATGLSIDLRCQRPQQSLDGMVTVCLKDGDVIDDSVGTFDALNFSGERKKALLALGLGNYLLSVKPTESETLDRQNWMPSSFEWSDDLQGARPARLSGLFDKLRYQIKAAVHNQTSKLNFSIIHCGQKDHCSESCGIHFLVRTIARELSLTKPSTSGKSGFPMPVAALKEQVEILILPTIRVSNMLSTDIVVSATDFKGTGGNTLQGNSSDTFVKSGERVYMYADLSKLCLNITLSAANQTSEQVNGDYWRRIFKNSTKEMQSLDVGLNFGEQKNYAMLRMSRADTGLLEVIVYTTYALQNDTEMPLICYPSIQKSSFSWKHQDRKKSESSTRTVIPAKNKISWLEKSQKLWIERAEPYAIATPLDLRDLSGSAEMMLVVKDESGEQDIVNLGITSQITALTPLEPTHTICFVPRHIVINESTEDIVVCQYGMQETRDSIVGLSPGQQTMLKMKIWTGNNNYSRPYESQSDTHRHSESEFLLFLQFSLKGSAWDWSGPICASSLGRFYLKLRRSALPVDHSFQNCNNNVNQRHRTLIAVVETEEEGGSLVMHFQFQQHECLPYQIVNCLPNASISFHQKGIGESEVLEPDSTTGFSWDDLRAEHLLVVQVTGTQFSREINLDKLCPCKPFLKSRQSNRFTLPFLLNDIGHDMFEEVDLSKVAYEVYADGPTRVLKISEVREGKRKRGRMFQAQVPYAKLRCKVSVVEMSLLGETHEHNARENSDAYNMILLARARDSTTEITTSNKYTLIKFNVQGLQVDKTWEKERNVALLRGQAQDIFEKDENMFHLVFIMSNNTLNPYQVKLLSLSLQNINVHVDEDTLMKLVPFYRRSESVTNLPRRQIYFEHFEIQPIKIIVSFHPGKQLVDYTSTQETLRAFLHSIVKLPDIKEMVVELNGVILSHVLVTSHELAVKCAQHYSWYVMRAIYVAKGSHLLPPAFSSLFDDSAFATLDYFLDPSMGIQGFTKGVFSLLQKGFRRKDYFRRYHYLQGVSKTVKKAGHNVLFVAIREISDNVLKGAETNGFNGMVNGFRLGILKIAMEPSLLSTAFAKGGPNCRIKLDHGVGMDEMYLEGYLQAMLDTLFKQEYLRIKVVDDQVLLKNLPPNSSLIDEIMEHVKHFLRVEGLLMGESSVAPTWSLRRSHRDSEWKLGPRLKALSEQLFVIFAIRALRKQLMKIFNKDQKKPPESSAEPSQTAKKDLQVDDSRNDSNTENKDIKQSLRSAVNGFLISTVVAYVDGRLCRHIPNDIVRRIVSGFLLSFVEQS